MNRALTLLLGGLAVVILAANFAFRTTAASDNAPGNEAWALDRMDFVAWNGVEWTAWIHDGAFELKPRKSGRWSRHSSASVAFIGWDGTPWQAKIDDDQFLLAPRGEWEGDVEESEALRYRDWAGNNQLRTVGNLER